VGRGSGFGCGISGNILIESINSGIDNIQKWMKLRSELISLLSCIRACEEMQKDLKIICEKYSLSQDNLGIDVIEKESEEIILNVMKKAKIYQKASHIAVN
jgi:hypothetical protein